jgi:hypothetical protein
MPDPVDEELPFRVEFDAASGQVVLWATIEQRRGKSIRRIEVPSLEALTIAVAEHLRESRVHRLLAEHLVQAAVDHLDAELQDPASTIPLGSLLACPARTAS